MRNTTFLGPLSSAGMLPSTPLHKKPGEEQFNNERRHITNSDELCMLTAAYSSRGRGTNSGVSLKLSQAPARSEISG